MDTVKIGRFIAKKRKELGLTQQQLAEKLGVTNKTISRWENGNYMPDLSIIEPLSEILEISLNEFFAGEEIKVEELTREKVVERTENSISETLYYSNRQIMDNKRKYIKITIGIVLFIFGVFLMMNHIYFKGVPYYEGDVSKWQELFPNHSAYELAISYSEQPVFKDEEAALKKAISDYSDAISTIRKEYNVIVPLSRYTYKIYAAHTKQMIVADERIMEQNNKLQAFLDIYENTFEWKDVKFIGRNTRYKGGEAMNEQMNDAIMVVLLLFAMAFYCLVMGGCVIYKQKEMKRLQCEAKGKVIGLVKSHLFRNETHGEVPGDVLIGWGVSQGEQFWGGFVKKRIPPWFPCVKYEANGKEIIRIMGEGNVKDAWRIGQEVTVLYDAEIENKSWIRGDESLTFKIKFYFLLALLFVLTGAVSIWMLQ